MNKSVSFLLLFLFSILIFETNNGTVYANPKDAPPSIEEKFTKIGYKSVKEAVEEFKNHFKRDVKLISYIF